MIRNLVRLLVFLAVLASGAAGAVWAYATAMLARGTERAISYALQVDVQVGEIRLRPLDGQFEIGDLVIGNPDGFNTRNAFKVRRIVVTADLPSLRTDTPTIQLIEVIEPKVTLERGLHTSNLKALSDNASRFRQSALGTKPEPVPDEAPEASKKKLKVDKLTIDGTEVALSAPILRGQEILFPLSRIEMNDLGGGKGGVGMTELLGIIIDKILTTTLTQGMGIIPEGFNTFGELGDRLLEGAVGGLKGILGGD